MYLGVDPGIAKTGYVILDPSFKTAGFGIIKTDASSSLYHRAWKIAEELVLALQRAKVSKLHGFAYEIPILGAGGRRFGAAQVNYQRGWLDAAMVTALSAYNERQGYSQVRVCNPGLTVTASPSAVSHCAIPNATVKKWATGKGNADKTDMIRAASSHWPELFKEHAAGYWEHIADAAAIAWYAGAIYSTIPVPPDLSKTWQRDLLTKVTPQKIGLVLS